MYFDDPFPEDLDPVLRPAPADHISHIEIRLHVRAVELVDVPRHRQRLDEKGVPDILDQDVDAFFLGVRNGPPNRRLRAPVILHERALGVRPHNVEDRGRAV